MAELAGAQQTEWPVVPVLGRPGQTGRGSTGVGEGPGQVPAATASVATPLTEPFHPEDVREEMAADSPALKVFLTDVTAPPAAPKRQPDAPVVEL